MDHLKLKLDEGIYQYLKTKFNGDEKAINDFVNKVLTKELAKTRINKNTTDKNLKKGDLKDYLKSGKSGSRSYGIKGQGW